MTQKTDQWREPTGDVRVVVASHRRSGTHLALEYIARELGVPVHKSHQFHDSRSPDVKVVYIARHPIDTLWSTYRWFVHGESGNPRIAAATVGLTFEEFLTGAAGPGIGFAAMKHHLSDDALLDASGMFYSPARFWADHVQSHLQGGPNLLVVRYEDLLAEPQVAVARIAAHLSQPAPESVTVIPRDELVGHSASIPSAESARSHWTDESIEILRRDAGDVMAQLGYTIPDAVANGPRRGTRRHDVRYVSRTDNSGISVAGRRCVLAMTAAGIDVAWEPEPQRKPPRERRRPPTSTDPRLAELYRPYRPVEQTVMHTGPEFWAVLRSQLEWGQFIGHTVWETDRVPSAWRGGLHSADAIWVPTQWNRNVFEADDVRRPITVIPHVINTDPADDPPVDIPDDVTIFTSISTWHPRKRPDRVVEAFAHAFTADDPVVLILKTPAWTDAMPAATETERMTWFRLAMVLRRFPRPPRVLLVNDEFTDAQITGLLQRTDCYVSLSSSEGWGLGQFDAATLGKPVITTAFGGHLEYFGLSYPGLVPYQWEQIGESEHSPHLEQAMQWANPDLEVAARMMREVAAGTSSIPAAARSLSTQLNETYAPLRIGRQIIDILDHTT